MKMRFAALLAAVLLLGCTAQQAASEQEAQPTKATPLPGAPDLRVYGSASQLMAPVNAKVKFVFSVVNEGEGNCSSFEAAIDLGDGYNWTETLEADCRRDCFGAGAVKRFEFERAYKKWGYREISFEARCTQTEESYANNAFKARLLVYPLG